MFTKEKTCAFTGHRPEKLNLTEEEAKRLLCHAIQKAIDIGYTTFITGLAKGVDVWAGEIVLDFKNIYPEIKLICALPYPGFAKNSPRLIENADFVHTVMDSYSIYSYQKRNEWMVDNSSLIIALFTGKKGGTQNTIKYAEKNGVEIMYATQKPIFSQISFYE
ncbi:MAG: SLOG family protein [Clostridia bacterium]